MGLTIHYSLHFPGADPADARRLVDQLRHRAKDLPFTRLGDIVELSGPECDCDAPDGGGRHRWLLIQATRFVESGDHYYDVPPERLIAFTTSPAKGSEPANFGLCLYPKEVPAHKHLKTGLSAGWHWSGFCKTQYASNPSTGGVENFLRAHLSIVRVLDHARDLGILASVHDEGGYWEKRDVKALAEMVGKWNQAIAAFVGGAKDLIGGNDVQAEITKYPNYEHLEAKGRREEGTPEVE